MGWEEKRKEKSSEEKKDSGKAELRPEEHRSFPLPLRPALAVLLRMANRRRLREQHSGQLLFLRGGFVLVSL